MIRPTNNPLSRGYTSTHKGYDFRGLNLPDEVKASADGEIVQRVDEYTTNWKTIGTLTTRDYGNYIKIKHTDGSFELHAHLKKGSALNLGTKVKAGQIIARIGNTGNSTGTHLHSEYRNIENINIPVTFKELDMTDTTEITRLKEELAQTIRDKESLTNQVNGWVRDSENGTWVARTEVEKREQVAYSKGFDDGKATLQVTSTSPDESVWVANGKTVTTIEGNQTVTLNYERKQ